MSSSSSSNLSKAPAATTAAGGGYSKRVRDDDGNNNNHLQLGSLQQGPSSLTDSNALLHYRDREGSRYEGDTPTTDRRPHSDIGTSPSDPYTPSSLHSLHSQSQPQSQSRSQTTPTTQPINAVLAAFANSDLQYSGIMRPHDGITYDRRQQQYNDPSPDHHRSTTSFNNNSSARSNQEDRDSHIHQRDRDILDSRHDMSSARHSNYSPPHRDRYSHMHSSHSAVHSHAGSNAPTAPGSSDHSPRNPASSHPYDRATPPQPQGYRPYLASPGGTDSNGNVGDRDRRDVESNKRPHDAGERDQRNLPLSASGDRSRHPWEDGYRNKSQSVAASEAPSVAATTTAANDGEPPPKKRRRAKAAPNQDIPDGAEVEYEDPSGDRTRGPVFVHPPKGAVQACIRCHRIKRKCDGAWPRCASCARVDVACVFELSAATSNYVHKLKKTNSDLVADLRASEARIHALEMQLSGDDKGIAHNGINSEFGRLALSAASIREHAPLSYVNTGGGGSAIVPGSASPPPRRGRHNSNISTTSREGSNLYLSDILSRDEAIKCAQHYFDFNGLAYPLLERAEVVPEMLELYDTEKERDRERANLPPGDRMTAEAEDRADRRKFLIYMMLTLGRSAAVRLGDEHSHNADKALYAAALRYRAKALSREDMLCVQALLLMTLYSTEVPEAGSLWQTLGLAGRVVMAIGLHRRADAHVPPEIAEPRRRLFYSFYNLDRLVASTLSKPLTIAEHDIDIELPTDRPNDQPYRGWPIMHICRYLVRYRRLLGCTLTALYSVNGEQNALPEPERRAIVGRLHEELEAWAADGPNPKGAHTIRTINHDKWLAIHYHQLLCMLYRPSPLYPDTTPATLRALHDASSKCVDLYCELWNVNKVGFNLIQIVGLFVACISLLCCLCECDTRMHSAEVAGPATTAATLAELGLPYSGVDDPSWAAEIRARVGQCRNLFETVGAGAPLSAKYRDIFTRVSELLLARYGPLHRDAEAPLNVHSMPSESTHAVQVMDSRVDAPVSTPADAHPVDTPAHVPHDHLAGDIAGAWDAMSQLWYDLGDLFGDESGAEGGSGPGSGGGQGSNDMNLLGNMNVGNINMPGSVGSLPPMSASSGMPGLPGVNVVPGSLAGGVGGGAYPALAYPPGAYGQYAAYAASYPGPYGPYGEGGFDDTWAEHWRPEGENWWGHLG